MILIADDDPDFADTCSMMLEGCGYDVSVVANGAQALVSIGARQPELLISDCSMPGIGGIELSQALRARPADAQFPIILMSGSMRCTVAQGSSYDVFLRKPFSAEALLHEVRQLVASAHAARSNAGH